MKKILDNNQIVDELLKLHKLENDNQLANHYGVERQQIRQFRNAKRVGLTQKIMSELLVNHTSQSQPKIESEKRV